MSSRNRRRKLSPAARQMRVLLLTAGFDTVTELARAARVSRRAAEYAIAGEQMGPRTRDRLAEALRVPPQTLDRIVGGES